MLTVESEPPGAAWPMLAPGRAALIVAHPGHELRAFGWLSHAQPVLHILTAGDGAHGHGRAEGSRDLIAALGCRVGAVFAAVSDRTVYEAIRHGRSGLFTDLLERLVDGLIADRIDVVVGDAAEGYNPTHDLCRVLIDAAVHIVRQRTGQPIANFALPLAEWELGAPDTSNAVRLRLTPAMLSRKLSACRAYPGMEQEVERALAAQGEAYFADELFTQIGDRASPLPASPHYESVGRERVLQGVYAEALTYADHVAPTARAIADHAALEFEAA